VFVESSVPRRSIDAVVEGCRARGHAVVVGGTLYSDAMGAAGTPEGNYVGMVRANVRTIVGALR
jgi:manganese/zinc/iron transport system substrate-binding protein